ncbi:hypothetical protein [Mesorhizobium sp.]|uniref:hypothetical protein n=1 Tax=Mesorhizobium sp. TaxID=1871066 RepID=UPI000FE8DD94|nr:hypothetical protein [Mesorhizobium sp.]RWP51365.1 MAG: hypothetical protein EOR06_22460 [Mesorhizobium sp.]
MLPDPDCRLLLDESLGLSLHWTHPFGANSDDDARVEFISGAIVDFFQVRSNFDLAAGTMQVELTPTREPMDLLGSPTTKAWGLLVNGPRLTHSMKEVLCFATPELSIAVQSFGHAAELLSGRLSKHTPPAITHRIVVGEHRRRL